MRTLRYLLRAFPRLFDPDYEITSTKAMIQFLTWVHNLALIQSDFQVEEHAVASAGNGTRANCLIDDSYTAVYDRLGSAIRVSFALCHSSKAVLSLSQPRLLGGEHFRNLPTPCLFRHLSRCLAVVDSCPEVRVSASPQAANSSLCSACGSAFRASTCSASVSVIPV
jgi:hypothetical protein